MLDAGHRRTAARTVAWRTADLMRNRNGLEIIGMPQADPLPPRGKHHGRHAEARRKVSRDGVDGNDGRSTGYRCHKLVPLQPTGQISDRQLRAQSASRCSLLACHAGGNELVALAAKRMGERNPLLQYPSSFAWPHVNDDVRLPSEAEQLLRSGSLKAGVKSWQGYRTIFAQERSQQLELMLKNETVARNPVEWVSEA